MRDLVTMFSLYDIIPNQKSDFHNWVGPVILNDPLCKTSVHYLGFLHIASPPIHHCHYLHKILCNISPWRRHLPSLCADGFACLNLCFAGAIHGRRCEGVHLLIVFPSPSRCTGWIAQRESWGSRTCDRKHSRCRGDHRSSGHYRTVTNSAVYPEHIPSSSWITVLSNRHAWNCTRLHIRSWLMHKS